jgi:hypothetical protein
MQKLVSISYLSLLIFALCMLNAAFAATIQLPRTGQSACYNASGAVIACSGTGQDGDKLRGVAATSPRFTNNSNGTVTDNLTGLIWLKNANCTGALTWANALIWSNNLASGVCGLIWLKNANCFGEQMWETAITSANTLASGACGLTDGSTVGKWRLPNRKELMSLVDRSKSIPALPSGHPFTSVQSSNYWSSSSFTSDFYYNSEAWVVDMYSGGMINFTMAELFYVWPVRAGQ